MLDFHFSVNQYFLGNMIKAKYFRTSFLLDPYLLAYSSPVAVPWGERQLLNLEFLLVSFSCAGTTYPVGKKRSVCLFWSRIWIMRFWGFLFTRALKAKMYHSAVIITLLYHGNVANCIKYS